MASECGRSLIVCAFFVLLSITPATMAAAPSFQGIGDLPGGAFESYAYGVSGDGSVVVGTSRAELARHAFRWTVQSGMEDLGDLLGLGMQSRAWATSYDGAVIAGESSTTFNSEGEPVRWTIGDGGALTIQRLPTDPDQYFGAGKAVSAEGQFIAGFAKAGSSQKSYRWDLSNSSRTFILDGTAYGISADGAAVVGTRAGSVTFPGPAPPRAAPADDEPELTAATVADDPAARAFRWTATGGTTLIGDPAAQSSLGFAISADGTTAVGSNYYNDVPQAFFSGLDGISHSLGAVPSPWIGSDALAVSGDGSFIIGTMKAPPPEPIPSPRLLLTSADSPVVDEAFIWDSQLGMRNLKEVLQSEFGFDLTGWTLSSATGISSDGTIIVGNGINPLGQQEAWVATVPEPGATCALMLAAALLTTRRRAEKSGTKIGKRKSGQL